MSQTDVAAPGRKGRSVLLIVSLCLNVLLIGILCMGILRLFFWPGPETGRGRPHGPGLYFGIGQGVFNPDLMRRVSPAKSDALRAVIDQHRPRLQQLRRASVAARGAALDAFTADKFDQVAFDKALSGIAAADSAFEAGTMQVISASVAKLSAQERQEIARRWQKEHRHGGDGPPRGGQGMGGGWGRDGKPGQQPGRGNPDR